jgi:hypothetical protein
MASILVMVLLFALVGFVVWLIVTYIPMPPPFPQVIIVACVVLLVLYLISIITGHSTMPVLR